jgi:parvulin-like peptidyl-prolyl isomerase
MSVVLQVGDRAIATDDLLHLLAGYQMLPQLLQEILIDQAIAPITCTDDEAKQAQEQFFAQNQITSEETLHAWMSRHGMTPEQLKALMTRSLKVEKFKAETWGNKLESYFLSRKSKLDKVIYSLIRTQDIGIAQEIYFRVLEGEQSFAELAREYSKGPEAQTDGLIGPVELSVPHPNLAQMLTVSQPGQLWPPTRIGEWIVIVRLEKFVPAQMDEAMRRRLLTEFFNVWLQENLDHTMTASPGLQPAIASSPPINSLPDSLPDSSAPSITAPSITSATTSAASPAPIAPSSEP